MRFRIVFWCCMTILVRIVVAKEGAIFSGIFGNKPDDSDIEIVIVPENVNDDGCPRQYLLTPKDKQQVPYAFKRYGIVPDLLDVPPTRYLKVEYGSINHCQPNLGNDVFVCGVVSAPSRLKWNCSPDRFYTIFFIDINPYGTIRPKLGSQAILWWVVNIPGCNVGAGKTIFQYQSPLPLYGAGKSRYAMLVYEQPEYQIDWSDEPLVSRTSEKNRYYRCLDKLVNKYELTLFAGNFFVSTFKPCLEAVIDTLDIPEPQHVIKATEAADLPADPFITPGRTYGNILYKTLTFPQIMTASDEREKLEQEGQSNKTSVQ